MTLSIPGLEDIGEIGGGGSLFRAREEDSDRWVAVRLVEDLSECTVTAVRALSRHPNAVAMMGSGVTATGQGYLMFELLEEGSLGEWVAADGRLPCGDVLGISVKIAGALETAHRAGVVHGDLRPERIFVSPSGEPRLAGLDLAILRHAKAAMAGWPQPTVRDDVVALGATMHMLLTAASPEDGIPEAVLERCEVPPSLGALVCRCLTVDPADRPESVHEIAATIGEIQADLGLRPAELYVDEAAATDAREALTQTASPAGPADPSLDAVDVSEPEPELHPQPEPERKPKPVIVFDDLEPLEPWLQPSTGEATEPKAPPMLSRRRLFRVLGSRSRRGA